MSVQVTVRQLQPQPIAVVSRRAARHELPKVVPDACGVVWRFIRSNGVAGAGRHVAIYYDEAVNLEVGVEVPDGFAGQGDVYASRTPAGLAVCATHVGPYQLLGDTYQMIWDWCRSNGRERTGPCWEVYGHWTDDPAKLTTDIFYLLKT